MPGHKHKHIVKRWEPVEIEYHADGVSVWQEGRCACGALLQRDFEPTEPRVLDEGPRRG